MSSTRTRHHRWRASTLLLLPRPVVAEQQTTGARSACIPVLGVRGASPRPGRTGKSDSTAKKGKEATLIERPPTSTSEGRKRSIADAAGRETPRPPTKTIMSNLV